MPRLDIVQQVNRYRGFLGWNAAGSLPDIEIELFIKEHPIAIRKPKVTEINTISVIDPLSLKETSTPALFYGDPELLQLQLSGWIITPRSGSVWDPKSKAGASLAIGNMSYAEIVTAFVSGKMNPNTAGTYVRRDPDYYISPYGHQYTNPIIAVWTPQYSVNMKKQPFNMTLYLEK